MPLKFIVVDDDADNAMALAMVIEALGHQAHTACSAEDALRVAAEIRPHAALLDWLMPGTDGIRLASLLADEWPDLFLVLVTGYGWPDLPEEARLAGVTKHLLKPVSIETLQSVIETVEQHVATRPSTRDRLPAGDDPRRSRAGRS